MSKILPENIIRQALADENIKAFTKIGSLKNLDKFVLIVRTSDSRSYSDINHYFENRSYNFLLQCFHKDGLAEAAALKEEVADIIDELNFDRQVQEVIFSNGGPLPNLDNFSGYSASLTITL